MYTLNYNYLSSNCFYLGPRMIYFFSTNRTNHTNSNIFNALVTCVKCLEGTTERSDSNRVRSARQGEVRMTCLEGTTPQDLPLCSLIAFVRFVRPNRSPLNAKHEIRVDFFDIFGCTRHNPNKFGSALVCTKIRKIRGQKIVSIITCG